MTTQQARFTIFEGELSDIPGRCESWTEHLMPLGDDSWELMVEGTDFTGLEETEPISQRFTTDDLLSWLHERDHDYMPSRKLGPRLRALRAYAKHAGLTPVIKNIERVRRGTWPPKPRVIRIVGVTSIGSFPFNREPRHIFLEAETTRGSAIMAVPSADAKFVRCWLGWHPYGTPSWRCRLRKELAVQGDAVLASIRRASEEIPVAVE